MASLQLQADTAVNAISSLSTCSAAIAVLLKDLLLAKGDSSAADKSIPDSRTAKPARQRATTKSDAKKTKAGTSAGKEELSSKEKATLATQVINAALRTLTESSKPQPAAQSTKAPMQDGDLARTAATRNALRRSSSAPSTPLRPRSLNRISTSPVLADTKGQRAKTTTTNSTNLPSLVECTRVAFATLRTLQAAGKITLPDLQLETGISSFIGKLVALGLHEQAVKELRILKRRLQGANATVKSQGASEAKSGAQSLAEILDFGQLKAPGKVLALAITCQINMLRILHAMKKPAYIEVAVPYLRQSHESSPINLCLAMAQDKTSDITKTARQMETVAQCLLALTPNVSSREDGAGMESRLSVSPASALELQTLGFECRSHWWRLVSHKGDWEKEVISPYSKCLTAYIRRSQEHGRPSYLACAKSFERIHKHFSSQDSNTDISCRSPLFGIFQALATQARESGNISDAVKWSSKLRDCVDAKKETPARYCSLASQLLSLQLKNPREFMKDDLLLQEVVDVIQGPLRGEVGELNELLVNASAARKAAMMLLAGQTEDQDSKAFRNSSVTIDLLVTLIIRSPRFCLRWLGKPPGPKSNTKEYLRYEQRRQLLSKHLQHCIDSAFWTMKMRLDAQQLSWDTMDSILADCLTLLEYMGDLANPETPSASFWVKISNFYYMQYKALRAEDPNAKNASAIRALRHSIDCIKYRTSQEKERANLTFKLERMAELCKGVGRIDEALSALQTIRSSLVDDGVLRTISIALASRPALVAWSQDDKAEALSRCLVSISKMEQVWMDWTVDMTEVEQAAALEHRLFFILLADSKKPSTLTLEHPTVDGLLRIYKPTHFPLRRLRLLLNLLCLTIGNRDLHLEIQSIAQDALHTKGRSGLGEDSNLAGFLPHMNNLYKSLSAIAEPEPNLQALDTAISTWRTMVNNCPERVELEKVIDDLAGLLKHLSSAADLLRVQGHDKALGEVLELAADITRIADGPKPEDFLGHHSSLALQCVALGQSSRAEQTFQMALDYTRSRSEVPGEVLSGFHMAMSEYFLLVGDVTKAEAHLTTAKDKFSVDKASYKSSATKIRLLLANASYLLSLVALEKGESHNALVHSRNSIRAVFQDWARLESQITSNGSEDNADKSATEDGSSMDISTSGNTDRTDKEVTLGSATGPAFWSLAPSLIRGIIHLSTLYAHLGNFRETVYYAEQAQKVARSTGSARYMAQCSVWMATIYAKAANPTKALEMMEEAKAQLPDDVASYRAVLACQMSATYSELKDDDGEATMIASAEAIIKELARTTASVNATGLEKQMASLEITEKPVPARGARRGMKTTGTATRATRTTRTTARATSATKKIKSQAALAPTSLTVDEDVYVSRLRASVILQKAVSLVARTQWPAAMAVLEEAKTLRKMPKVMVDEQVVMAACLLGMGMEEMANHSVFSVVQDSTISFPAVSIVIDPKSSPGKASPPRKARRGAPKKSFAEYLQEAQECLVKAHGQAVTTGDSGSVQRISSMLQNIALFLSASTKTKPPKEINNSVFLTELARNLTWSREQKAILTVEKSNSKISSIEWPDIPKPATVPSTPNQGRASLGPATDAKTDELQHKCIDILPAPWTVVSLSLSDNKRDLCITKLRRGQATPFVIRLPLERASSRDGETDGESVLDFHQGRAELAEIVKLVNESCHDKRDFSAKGAKTAWWAGREELDVRMGDLLRNIEDVWLGGFRGIFARAPHEGLFGQFQVSFTAMLNKHLPSRRPGKRGAKMNGTSHGARVTPDPSVLALFVGLGDASAPGCDFDEALTDLLYFVVDILQFHGEENAYDELDFDAMMVDTFDALYAYHSGLKTKSGDSSAGEAGAHTILILDKALHSFPWESLPCMQGVATSRVPSLACLKRLLDEQQKPSSDVSSLAAIPGHYVSAASGTYMINPGGDLKSTEEAFSQRLATHLTAKASSVSSSPSSSPTPSGWKAIIGRRPSEDEFEQALAGRDTLLYFGHGSGAQFIRGRTVRRLDKCRAAALLMGCSSARLDYAGDSFEVHGPAWNYMLAGCPAVVGTLWDVTDRDIDRYTGRLLEEWGLVPSGTFRALEKGNNRKKESSTRGEEDTAPGAAERTRTGTGTSLVEAVARARNVCRFRYVTAAAPVVYGIPVYVSK